MNNVMNNITPPGNISINNSNNASLSKVSNFQSTANENPYRNTSYTSSIETIDLSMFVNEGNNNNKLLEEQPVINETIETLEDFPHQVEITSINDQY